MPQMSYYDPLASHMRADTLADFLRAPLRGNVEEVPGVGKDTAAKLASAHIVSTQQLIGVYLQHGDCNAFYKWLQTLGVNAHRNTVVRCISEKAAQMFVVSPPLLSIDEEPTQPTVPVAAPATQQRATKPRQRKRKASNNV